MYEEHGVISYLINEGIINVNEINRHRFVEKCDSCFYCLKIPN